MAANVWRSAWALWRGIGSSRPSLAIDPFGSEDESYRTCSTCGSDCEPDTALSADRTGVRIAFVCTEHGAQSVVDPFKGVVD